MVFPPDGTVSVSIGAGTGVTFVPRRRATLIGSTPEMGWQRPILMVTASRIWQPLHEQWLYGYPLSLVMVLAISDLDSLYPSFASVHLRLPSSILIAMAKRSSGFETLVREMLLCCFEIVLGARPQQPRTATATLTPFYTPTGILPHRRPPARLVPGHSILRSVLTAT